MSFKSYIKDMELCGKRIPYVFASQQAVDWFDPLKPYTKLEYEWVIQNIPLEGEIVLDAGCHQGNYSVVFAACGANVIAVDAYQPNCEITAHNLGMYKVEHNIHNCAVWSRGGLIGFAGGSNGHVVGNGGAFVPCATLPWLGSQASVVKVDIEGAEFEIFPKAFDDMPDVGWWIVEIHPTHGEPEVIISAMANHGYDLWKVDRELMAVVPYAPGEWLTHATVIGGKK